MKEPMEGKIEEKQVQDESEVTDSEESMPSVEEAEKTQVSNESEIAKMQQELEQANDMMLRLAAELENYKKRVAKDRESQIKYAAQNLIEELLPILDNFERAIESANKSEDFISLLEGVKMISKQMHDVLEKKGVSRIDAVGKTFDPTMHEAVMHIASEEHPENVVVEEFQKGYMLHDRVIRPAMVAVSKGAEEE